MRCIERLSASFLAVLSALLLASCGGNSTETTIIGGGTGGSGGSLVTLDSPTGPNTTEIVVDSGPPGDFSLVSAPNIAYVTVTVCTPGSATDCVTIDHVSLDTGSIGLRLFKSKVATLALPQIMLPPANTTTPAGAAVECYQFVLGGLWGPLARADLQIAGERANSLPVQLIDDSVPATYAAPKACVDAASGGLQTSAASLQANGILGIGMLAYDCGLLCNLGDYTGSSYAPYYSCTGSAAATCSSAAVPYDLQTQNPVVHFAVNNNGTIINLPALPDLGAGIAKGRLVFGIGTQTNNQIPVTAKMYFVDTDPTHSESYLGLTTKVGTSTYTNSYIDSGSNALFFDDTSIAQACKSSSGSSSGWYCPTSITRRTATISDFAPVPVSGPVDFSVANADALFTTSSVAFSNLAGSIAQGSNAFVWGLPFFYGRSVFTSIWKQDLSQNGPWNAF